MNLPEIMSMFSSVYSGTPINHSVFIGNNGVWASYQSLVSYFPYRTKTKCSVDTKSLKGTLNVLSDSDCVFKEKELEINYGKIKIKLPYTETDTSLFSVFKRLKTLSEKEDWIDIPNEFESSINICSKTVSENAVHGTLTCFNFKDNQITTSNNISVSVVKFDGKFCDCLLNKQSLIGALAINPTHFKSIKNYVLFKNSEGVIVSLPTVSGEYPDFSDILNVKCDRFIEMDMEVLGKIADVSEKLFEGGDIYDNTLKFDVKNRKLYVKNIVSSGSISSSMDIDYDGELSFSIDSKTLKVLTDTNTNLGVSKDKIVVKTSKITIITAMGC